MNYKCTEVSVKNIATDLTVSKLVWDFTWRQFFYASLISTIIVSLFTTPVSPYTWKVLDMFWNKTFMTGFCSTIGTVLLTKLFFGGI